MRYWKVQLTVQLDAYVETGNTEDNLSQIASIARSAVLAMADTDCVEFDVEHVKVDDVIEVEG